MLQAEQISTLCQKAIIMEVDREVRRCDFIME